MDLTKLFQAPGLAEKSEIEEAISWLSMFKTDLDTYRRALGEPIGHSVQSRLDVLEKVLDMKEKRFRFRSTELKNPPEAVFQNGD